MNCVCRLAERGLLLRSISKGGSLRRKSLATRSMPASSPSSTPSIVTDGLWQQITATYDSAQAAAASSITDTTTEELTDCGVRFVLKVATTLRDKPKAPSSAAEKSAKKAWRNPFLPPDPHLFVCHLSPSHSLVLNKFNVVPHHALVITREFVPQEIPLSAQDFAATWAVMQAMPLGGLAYFNCGPCSGASQPHKHLQIVPLPLNPRAAADGDDDPPFQCAISAATAGRAPWGALQIPTLPFANFVALLDGEAATGERLADTHANLVELASQAAAGGGGDDSGSSRLSFNTVMTRQFMLVVPRRQEGVGPVSCNAMAFAGSFFVRGEDELAFIREAGPMHVLSQAGFPHQ